MLPLVEQHRVQIGALCKKYQVTRLELFGSAARGDFDPAHSDVDFLVEFTELGWQGSFKRYMGLKLELESLLGRQVDLVEPRAVTNRFFFQVANPHRTLIYAA